MNLQIDKHHSKSARTSVAFFFILSIVTLIPSVAQAWNDAGHMLIALLAYNELPPTLRTRVVEDLKKHPRFDTDFLKRIPAGVLEADTEKWLFIHAAAWPDLARSFSGADRKRYHMDRWHYVPRMIALEHAPAAPPDLLPSADPRQAASANEMNILQALNHCMDDLRNPNLPPDRRALAICWLLHLVGDLHQPCHAGSLQSARFPDGDKGGNMILIRDQDDQKLHAVWDNILVSSPSLKVLEIHARRIAADPTLSRDSLKDHLAQAAIPQWAQESFDLAREVVYDEKLRSAIKLQEIDIKEPFVPLRLSFTYMSDAHEVARKRAALAALRLTDLLRTLPEAR